MILDCDTESGTRKWHWRVAQKSDTKEWHLSVALESVPKDLLTELTTQKPEEAGLYDKSWAFKRHLTNAQWCGKVEKCGGGGWSKVITATCLLLKHQLLSLAIKLLWPDNQCSSDLSKTRLHWAFLRLGSLRPKCPNDPNARGAQIRSTFLMLCEDD